MATRQDRVRRYLQLAVAMMLVATGTVSQAHAQSNDASVPKQSQAKDKTDTGGDARSDATPASSKPLSPKELKEAKISADTEKLLKLAEELKAEVDKSNKDTLSLKVINKAAEVEKLARDLKQELRSQDSR